MSKHQSRRGNGRRFELYQQHEKVIRNVRIVSRTCAQEVSSFDKLAHLEDYVLDMQAVPHDYVLLGMDLKVNEEYAAGE